MALSLGSSAPPMEAIAGGHGGNAAAAAAAFVSLRAAGSPAASSSVVRRASKWKRDLVVCSSQEGVAPVEDLEISTRLGSISFPSRFLFGAATSAFQVEGTAFGGRGDCIWKTFCREHPEKIADGSNGDIAADSYHRYKEDVEILADLGLDAYRFSISWPRILPKGRGAVNKEGIQYYKNLIDELSDNGIEPFVTLFHWDVPQALEDEYGGFLNKKIVEDFKNYTRICFEEFGHKVKNWITINEPLTFSDLGYCAGVHAPGRCTPGLAGYNCTAGDSLREPYIVAHNLLLAHAEAARLYKNEYQGKQNGKVGITLVSSWFEPYDRNSPHDLEAQQRAIQFNLGWFLDPLEFGDYPFSMRALAGDRIPAFTEEESKKLKGSYDFIGINYYTARYAKHVPIFKGINPQTYNDDVHADILIEKDGVPIEHAEPGSWINVYPRGLRELLTYIKSRYNNPAIYITENGVLEVDDGSALTKATVDTHRTEYLTLHLHELTEAIRREANVKGYFTWSLLDNFEWNNGYTNRLGLIYIDYKDKTLKKGADGEELLPDRTRTKKDSAQWLKRFLSIKRKPGMTFGPAKS
ncbi:Beta-glucosidase 12 [Apostasia shenzhenica]|uniref:Beta-glucosidase 12 n=1 Tax=Apostasia shenzhenica TaxID=1088818 RepID=A0A2I0APG3_9ASPA|nr:Beta-glucosidase 12 [Apostasia shenzhenica]